MPLDLAINSSQQFVMQISIQSVPAGPQIKLDLTSWDKEALDKEHSKVGKGCNKIFHRKGYMNSEGTAPYDFECDSSHLCPQCDRKAILIKEQLSARKKKTQNQINLQKTHHELQKIREEYFQDKQGGDSQLSAESLNKLQAQVTRRQKGCGKDWVTQFGGMAAGPSTVTCQNNTFLCDKCYERVTLISRVAKDFPKIELKHIPEQDTMFWKGRETKFYFQGHI